MSAATISAPASVTAATSVTTTPSTAAVGQG